MIDASDLWQDDSESEIIKKEKDGKTYRSYDGGKSWVSTYRIEPEEQKRKDKELERKRKEGEILPGEAGFAFSFMDNFRDKLLKACNRRDMRWAMGSYQLAVIGFKKSVPGFDEAKFIDLIINKTQDLVNKEMESFTYDSILVSSQAPEFIQFLEKKRSMIKPAPNEEEPPKQGNEEKQEENQKYKTLDSLFKKTEDIEPAIDILRRIDPPLISEQNAYLKNGKSAFKIWLDILAFKGIVKPLPNDKILADILNAKFSGLKIKGAGSILRKDTPTIQDMYKTQITFYVSQLSQSGKMGK